MATDPTRHEADEGLLRRFLSAEPLACRTIESWARQILCYRRLGLSSDDIDDIVQEVLAAVWQAAARPQFHLHVGLHAFVRKITLARAIDRVRRHRVRHAESLSEHVDPQTSVSAQFELDEENSALFAALAKLEVRCREVIRLHYFEDWPYARIAALEGRSESTLRVRMFHCLRTLRGLLAGAGGGRT